MFVEFDKKISCFNGKNAEIVPGGILIEGNGYLIKDPKKAAELLELDEEDTEIFIDTCKRYLPTILKETNKNF